MQDLQIDIETMGTGPRAAIVGIAAVFFDLRTETIGDKYQASVHLGTAVRDGGTMDPGTVMFWLRQNDQVRKAVAYGARDIAEVLAEFRAWVVHRCPPEQLRPWANSPAFDLAILGSALDRANIARPWRFWNERDFRTVKAMHPAVEYDTKDKGEGAHDPTVDCLFQIEHLFKIKRHLQQTKGRTLEVV